MKSIKVRKIGKTRGRPSTKEIIVEKLVNKIFQDSIKDIEKLYRHSLIYGTGRLKINF